MRSESRAGALAPGRVAGCLLAALLLGGCQAIGGVAKVGSSGQGAANPPPHAPAHGARAKHRYHYYLAAEVYFDLDRRVYFYVSDGEWIMSAALPLAVDTELGARVALELETARPYDRHAEHRKKYPPGRARGHGKGRGKGKEKGHGRAHARGHMG